MEEKLHVIFTSALDGRKLSASCSGRISSSTHWIWIWVGVKKKLCSCQESNPGRAARVLNLLTELRLVQPCASHFYLMQEKHVVLTLKNDSPLQRNIYDMCRCCTDSCALGYNLSRHHNNSWQATDEPCSRRRVELHSDGIVMATLVQHCDNKTEIHNSGR